MLQKLFSKTHLVTIAVGITLLGITTVSALPSCYRVAYQKGSGVPCDASNRYCLATGPLSGDQYSWCCYDIANSCQCGELIELEAWYNGVKYWAVQLPCPNP
jgi:hypothetical protein